MKLKTLVGSMAVLGLVSTAAFAAPAAADNNGANSAFWMNVIDRNQDNAAGVVALQSGQYKVTGIIQTDAKYNSKRNGYFKDDPTDHPNNNKGSMGINLHNAELYYDNQINNWANVHIAMDYAPDFVTQNSYYVGMFFPEAYVTMTHNNLFAKVGQQYLNFSSTMDNSITTPVTQTLSTTNAVAATVGVVNIGGGLYADAALYNGSNFATDQTSGADTAANANNIHGYTAEVGYTMKNNVMSYNVFADYIGNMNDTLAAQYYIQTGYQPVTAASYIPTKSIAGYAVHADYNTGPFTVMADYVAAATKNPDVTFNGNDSTPSAYSMEADYGFMTANHNSMVYLGYEGTQQALGLLPAGSTSLFWLPKTRVLLGYGFTVSPNIGLKMEYANDTDYGTSDSVIYNKITTTPTAGTGQSDNRVTARLTVTF